MPLLQIQNQVFRQSRWAEIVKRTSPKEFRMNKSDLLNWLQEEYRQWEALLERIDPLQMDHVGVTSQWSFKDMLAHLIPDNRRLVASLQAIRRNEPEPPPPWPVHLQTDDEINAWIYETNRERSVRQILDESHQMFQQLFTAVKELPDDVKVDTVRQGERMYHLVRLGDQRIQPGYFFDHFHDDHEHDVRAWLSRIEKGSLLPGQAGAGDAQDEESHGC
jgi:hypothetical protein